MKTGGFEIGHDTEVTQGTSFAPFAGTDRSFLNTSGLNVISVSSQSVIRKNRGYCEARVKFVCCSRQNLSGERESGSGYPSALG